MTEMILEIGALPEAVSSFISTNKVKLIAENGTITITPLEEKFEKAGYEHLFGMFKEGKISVDKYLVNKRIEKELEYERLSRPRC